MNQRVMLIGRERAASEAAKRYLSYFGHEVAIAQDPASAPSEAEDMEPQVLVCDMNPSSGEQRADAVRKIRRTHNPAIVIISTHRRREIVKRFPEFEAADCLRKPISLAHLERAISSAHQD